jgi:hypothetical protein
MSQTYDLLPGHGQLRLPMQVQETLVGLGVVCNDLALALDEALLLDRRAVTGAEAAAGSARLSRWRGELAAHRTRATVTYLEQTTAVYALGAAGYVGYAAAVAVALVAGAPLPAWSDRPVRPGQIIAGREALVPLVQLAVSDTGFDSGDCDEELRLGHMLLGEAVEEVTAAGLAGAYDDPAALAGRPDGSVDVSVRYPQALHRYAAGCVWAVGLISGAPDRRQR